MNLKAYQEEYKKSITNSEKFWGEKAKEIIKWAKPFKNIYNGKLGSDKWFYDGELNACYNCIDRWAEINPNKIALIFDTNEGETVKFTYKESLEQIKQISHQIKHLKKGDCISFYLSMGPEAVFCALACARLGITHNAIFGGFSADSLRLRLNDSKSKMLITQDYAMRGEKKIDYLETVISAVEGMDLEILVFDKHLNTNSHYNLLKNARKWSEIDHCHDDIDCVNVDSENRLFYLYTSGSTGMPKGIVHSTGGYLLYAAYTLKTAFNIKENDIFCCTADIGWITGHSYSIYAPLCLGITSVILEGVPTYPNCYRLFNIVDKYKITQLYTAPTAIRIIKKYFEENPLDTSSYNLSSLKCLGSVGEPINKEAYSFFSKSFGNLHVVDTYWQTETGGFLIAPVVGTGKYKPECASLPMPGIIPMVISDDNIDYCTSYETAKIENPNVLAKIYIAKSWPGISRGILNNNERFQSSYFSTPFYYTGDEGIKDLEGDFWIRGRADDVLNVSGHRISTAEVESIACSHSNVAEAAVIAVNHEIKGQSMILFVVLKNDDSKYEDNVKSYISEHIGGFCRPDKVVKCNGIPKTATGKIMRRVLRSLVTKTDTGDLSTCVNIESLDTLRTSLA